MFTKAQPIFIKGKNREMNFQAGFVCRINSVDQKKYSLKMAAVSFCRIKLDGEFLHYGPARAPHGYLKVDELELKLKPGEHILTFEVAGYNCSSFYTYDTPSMLCCEIFEDNEVIAYTGRDFSGIALNGYREQKAARYSYQRAFTEIYYLDSEAASWEKGDFVGDELEVSDPGLEYIPRGYKLPYYGLLAPASYVRSGKYSIKNSEIKLTRYLAEESKYIIPYNELPNDIFRDTDAAFETCDIGETIGSMEYKQFAFPYIRTGFIHTRLKVTKPSEVYVVFSEKCRPNSEEIWYGDGQLSVTNIIKYRLPVGEFELESFECYSFKHIALMVKSGEIAECEFTLREYCYPIKDITIKTGDPILDKTVEACRQAFRQNTLDCFMDCPGRERGGWLCDSYFTGIASLFFTGDVECEREFLDTFQIAKLPEDFIHGLLPMCYPAGNVQVQTIPQWTMWYVMEVGKFGERGGDTSRYTEVIGRIIKFFEGYENSDGLLERLPSWNFVEWTRANQWVQDVNYPTNMLYTGVLRVAANVLGRPELIEKADKIKATIIAQSFDGEFFRDHAKRHEDGSLEVLPDRSAICQHEAIFFDIIDLNAPEYSALKHAVYDSFGALGDKALAPADIEPLDLFIGFAVRVEVMMKLGLYEQNLEEIKEIYGSMANKTGTLWEHRNGSASLNHGFGSFVGVRVIDCLKKLRGID